jgi:hypothetical protein
MDTHRPTQDFQSGDPRLIILWARRYAKSRTISFLVQWVFIVVMVGSIGIAGTLTNHAYLSGDTGALTASMIFMGLSILALAWFSMSRWSGEVIDRITEWMYGEEGYADYAEGARGPLPIWLTALGGGLVIYHIVGAMLISFNYLSVHMLQPFSALYMSPFFIIMILYQRLGFWAWLWPILYGLHGALLFFGAPISFGGQWQLLNLVAPVFAYGFVAIIVGHLYSRYALYRLKSLTRMEDTGVETSEQQDYNKDGAGE